MISSALGPHKLLSLAHTDTLAATVVRGDIIVGNATPAWSRLPIGASGFVFTSNGVDATWAAPATTSTGDWHILGNAGLVDATNFLGTTAAAGDKQLNFRVNNIRSGRIDHLLDNTFFGFQAALNTTTGFNTVIGSHAMETATTTTFNVAIGSYALNSMTTGGTNVAIGHQAMFSNTLGNENVAIGTNTLYSLVGSTHQNTAIGNYAGELNVSGLRNVFIGYKAGHGELGNDKLYIANTTTTTPLLGGDFATNQLFVNNGTVALPTYSFHTEKDKGMYSYTTDTIGFSTDGTSGGVFYMQAAAPFGVNVFASQDRSLYATSVRTTSGVGLDSTFAGGNANTSGVGGIARLVGGIAFGGTNAGGAVSIIAGLPASTGLMGKIQFRNAIDTISPISFDFNTTVATLITASQTWTTAAGGFRTGLIMTLDNTSSNASTAFQRGIALSVTNSATSGVTAVILNGMSTTVIANSGELFAAGAGSAWNFVGQTIAMSSSAGQTGTIADANGLLITAPIWANVTATPVTNYGIQIANQGNANTTTSYGLFIQAQTGSATNHGVYSKANIVSDSPTAGIGYVTGAGGTVTQITSKATGVTLNTICGQITMHNAALLTATSVSFTLTNSTIAAADSIQINFKSGNSANSYTVMIDATAAGSCSISLRNYTLGTLSEAVVLTFAVIKAVTA